MKIEKGVQPKYFEMVLEGRKSWEMRLADFKCKAGDVLVLLEQREGSRKLTGRRVECEIMYKFNTKRMLKYYSQKEIDKYGLLLLSIRRRFKYK